MLSFKQRTVLYTNGFCISYIYFESFYRCQHIFKTSRVDTTKIIYLLHLSRGAPKQLDVALPQDLLVLLQGVLGVLLAREKHEGVAGGPSVRVLDKEQTLVAVCDRALGAEEGQHFLGCGGERQPPHTDYHLVLFGQELGHLVGRTWSQRTGMVKHLHFLCTLLCMNWFKRIW